MTKNPPGGESMEPRDVGGFAISRQVGLIELIRRIMSYDVFIIALLSYMGIAPSCYRLIGRFFSNKFQFAKGWEAESFATMLLNIISAEIGEYWKNVIDYIEGKMCAYRCAIPPGNFPGISDSLGFLFPGDLVARVYKVVCAE